METFSSSHRRARPFGSYRTYEEWKPFPDFEEVAIVPVLTVPMRNGNDLEKSLGTGKIKVLTVPMRNGNPESTGREFTAVIVLTVPMRNGNRKRCSKI